jgi:CRP-like cAMP-binding protein
MEEIMNLHFLVNTALFRGTSEKEAETMLPCLDAVEKKYQKGELIYHTGECVRSVGLVLSGGVNIVLDDFSGNSSILNHADPGQIFAETYACIPGEPLMVDVVADEDSEILFLNVSRLMNVCRNACPYHNRLIQNLLQIAAMKNLALSRRSMHTSSKTIRGRLLSYLSEQAKHSGSSRFTIPFNRQELAEYLGVDRSAMSNELSKMQKEQLISFSKNSFQLKMQ